MKGKKLFVASAAALLGFVCLAGCGSKNKVKSITLTLGDEEIVVGDTESAKATVLAEGEAENLTEYSLESSDPEVLELGKDEKGGYTVTAKKVGKATITATSEFNKKQKDEIEVKVVDPYVDSIELEVVSYFTDEADDELEALAAYNYPGLVIEPTVNVKDHNAAYLKAHNIKKTEGIDGVSFESKNTEVASVVASKGDGYVFGIDVGSAEIVVTSTFDNKTNAKTKVFVKEPYTRAVELSSTGLYLIVDDQEFGSATLEAEVSALDIMGQLSEEVEFVSSDPEIATVDDMGNVVAVSAGTATITATAVDGADEDGNFPYAACTVTVAAAGSVAPANGAQSFVYSDAKDRTEILGALEKYAVENKLTGLTLYGDGGYVMYDKSVQKGTNQYVPGFGFGIASSGRLTADLKGESNKAWKRYYHTFETDDPGSLNYMDDKGAVVGDLIGFVSESYYGTYLNEEGNGYEWVGVLSTANRPQAVNLDEHKMATKWRVPVKVGAAAKYSTMSDKFAKYNNREIALQDYVTPYQIYYTQAYGLARSAENLSGSGSIKGAKAYYEASKNGFNAEAWNGIGIKSGVENGQSYLEFEFNQACTQFYAMYYLASSMFAPVPQEFILELGNNDLKEGVKTWGKSSADGSLSPKDTWLCTGAFMVEAWDKDQQIVFKRNPNWNPDDKEHYQIAGYHFNILSAAKQDPEAALNQFLDGKLHSCGIPSTKLDKYKNDPRATVTSDSSTFKLNLNTCDQNTWEQLFGINGSVTKTAKSQYWACEPAMNNKNFVSGLSFALNRSEIATTLGRTPTPNYFGSSYLSDPENGIAYNSTEAHKNAVKDLVGEAAGTDEYGFSFEKAKASFKKAAEELIADGAYKKGDTIEIEIAWQTTSDITREHSILKKYFEDAFNTADNPLKLNVKSWVGAVWSDVYYKKMMTGQFDIGFGSVSGNSLNPLNFLEVLKSDNSSTFTLNWGLDTNAVDGSLVYGGKAWSFDALWQAADQGAWVVQGANSPIPYEYLDAPTQLGTPFAEVLDNGDLKITADVFEFASDDSEAPDIYTQLAYLVFYAYDSTGTYKEVYEEAVMTDDQPYADYGYTRYTATFKAADIAYANNALMDANFSSGYVGVDLWYITSIFGTPSAPTYQTGIALCDLFDSLADLYPGD